MGSPGKSLPSPEPVTSHTQRLNDALGLSSAEPWRPQDRMKPTLCLLAYSTCRWWWPLLSLALARCPGAGGGHPPQAPGLPGEPVGLTEWAAVGPPRTLRHTLLCTVREGARPDAPSTPLPERPKYKWTRRRYSARLQGVSVPPNALHNERSHLHSL